MRPSTRNALILAIGLAIGAAELATGDRLPGSGAAPAGPGPAAAQTQAPAVASAGLLAPAEAETVGPALFLQPAPGPGSPELAQLRRESFIRRARHRQGGEGLEL